MPRKKAENANTTPPQVPDDSLNLDEIFKSLEGRTVSADLAEWAKSQDQIAKNASGLMAKVLGNSDDYKLVCEVVKGPDGRFQIYPKGAELKEPRDQDLDRVCDAIAILLDRSGLSPESAMEVFRSVELTVNLCWIRYQCNPQTGDITYPKLGDFGPYLFGGKVERYMPASARAAQAFLSATAEFWLLKKVRSEIEPLNLVDRIAEIRRRIAKPDFKSILTSLNELFPADYYQSLLSRIEDELEVEFEIEKKRLEGRKAIMVANETSQAGPTPEPIDARAIYDDELDSKRKSEGKLDFRQIMVLLSELIPAFENADNTKKGKFIAAISPYIAEKRIGDEFSYINSFAKDHADLVTHWRKELKSSKRGRPAVNKYKKNL